METAKFLKELREELNRITKAIAALESLDGTATATIPAAKAAPKRGGHRKGISAAGRKRISEAAKARWAARRKAASKPATKTGAHKPMSAATKKRLSELAKKRWAQRKRAAKAS